MTTPSGGARGGVRSPRRRRPEGSGLEHPFLRTLDGGLPVVRTWTEPLTDAPAPRAGAHAAGADGAGTGAEAARADVIGADAAGRADAGAPAVVELERPPGLPVLSAVGDPERLASLLKQVAADLRKAPYWVVLTRGTGELAADILAGWGLEHWSDWDRMLTTEAPDVPGADGVVVLDAERDAAAITDLLDVGNPRSDHRPGQPDHTWYGIRSGDGSLAAVGASVRRDGPDGSFAHLGGIATRPGLRGRGLGSALTARMTADGVRDHGLVTLGMYADNDAARRVYARLGFRVIHRAETWRRPG